MPAPDDEPRRGGPSNSPIDAIEGRWVVGTPAVPDFGRRTLTAIASLAVLFGLLYLIAA